LTWPSPLFFGDKMKKILKLKQVHPNGSMQHGSHSIGVAPMEFNLNEEEIALLKTIGPAYWIEEVVTEIKKVAKKVTKKVSIKE